MELVPWVLIVSLAVVVFIGLTSKNGRHEPDASWAIVLGLFGIIIVLRLSGIFSPYILGVIYISMNVINDIITLYGSRRVYRDPARDVGQLVKLGRPLRVVYVIPVHNEEVFIVRCVKSILEAVKFAEKLVRVTVIVVNDASTDNTRHVLDREFGSTPGVVLVHLTRNAKKKGAIAIGMAGGENWRVGYELFAERHKRKPRADDYQELLACLREVGCKPVEADLYMHTDSDSVITKEFIYHQVMAFLSDDKIGAVSGHCNVWLDPDGRASFVTRMQVAMYYLGFRYRKAAESAWDSVFCVSGPGAGFRAEAIFPVLVPWVDDVFGGRIYGGATDRMLTLLVLEGGWKVLYSALAVAETVVPANFRDLRSQWTRWKQNFWRMFFPVWKYAYKRPFPVAVLTYTRLLVSAVAPFLVTFHMVMAFSGLYVPEALLYIIGIAARGAILGVAYTLDNPGMWRYGSLRPVVSMVSTLWGSILTLRAFYMTIKGTFTWREGQKAQEKRGRFLYRWFVPLFEHRVLEVVIIISIIIALLHRLQNG